MTKLTLIAAVLMLTTAHGQVAPNPYDVPFALVAQTQIDQLVAARWSRLGIQPANVCSDAVFIRRVHLDTIGTLPTADEVRACFESREYFVSA